MEERVRNLIEQSDALYSAKQYIHTFWQEVAEQFYPEAATFTVDNPTDLDFASNLTTSYPLIARRSLGDAMSALLRPASLNTTSPGVWFNIRASDRRKEDLQARRWLYYATGVQRAVMYDRRSNFVRAAKEGDHSFVTFGQAVISYGLNMLRDRVVYQHWHLRDMAWTVDPTGMPDTIHRKWQPTPHQALAMFGHFNSPRVSELAEKDPQMKLEFRHIVMPTQRYKGKAKRPWISIWVDVTNAHVLQEIELEYPIYIIPRWVTVPGNQYAISPAVCAALPDARLIQAMTLTLLEASEKLADPPMKATSEAIRSDLQIYAGGVTWVDATYDERLGTALEPIYQPAAGQNLTGGVQMRADVREMINKAFYLDSLSLPPSDVREMTAFEVGQRISEWIRRAMPIFEPMEFEYNGQICEGTFELLLRNGAFGSLNDIPQSLRNQDVGFQFASPLHESIDKQRAQTFLEAKAALAQAADLDPAAAYILNAKDTLRDVLNAIGCPPVWIREPQEVQAMEAQAAQQQAAMSMAQGSLAGAQIAQGLGSAAKDFSTAQANQNKAAQ